MRWGFLSTAKIARKVLAGARASDRVEVVAVASRAPARAEAFARAHGIARAHGSYEALLDDAEVEAVYIALPNALHAEWTGRALEAGKHVLCEKPLSRRPGEVEALFDRADASGLVLSEGFMYRHHPQTERVIALVREGAVGSLRAIRGAFSFTLPGEDNVRFQRELGGGALLDVGCYCVSAFRLLAGEPERVYGERVRGPAGVDVRFAGILRSPRGVLGAFDCGFDAPFRDELEVVGADGVLFLDDPWHCRRPGIELRRDGRVEYVPVPSADPYRLELENLVDAARGVAELRLGRADALGQARALAALEAAADAGGPVTLDPVPAGPSG